MPGKMARSRPQNHSDGLECREPSAPRICASSPLRKRLSSAPVRGSSGEYRFQAVAGERARRRDAKMSQVLSGGVGIVKTATRTGGRPANRTADQQKIIELLAKIPAAQGGMKEEWSATPLAGAAGLCPQYLGDAMYKFQSFWKANGTFHNIDGVVDPGGNTLRVLNTLVNVGVAAKAGPRGLPPANTPDLSKTASGLRSMFPSPRAGSSPTLRESVPGSSPAVALGNSMCRRI